MIQQYIAFWLTPALWVLTASYAAFTLLLLAWWKRIPSRYPCAGKQSGFLTVIIPVRNEEQNILNLLKDLNGQTFPSSRFEVLVMDDGSSDNTAGIVKEFGKKSAMSLRLITLPDTPTKAPKKRAIETAMKLAKGNLIVTTDGDCRAKPGWLEAIADCHAATGARLISGPVTFNREKSLTDHLQTVEFSSLIGSGASAISAGFPSLCNGANLAYEKEAFFEVNGYEGVRHIASGDDEFLMHKISAKFPKKVIFLKNADAVIATQAHQDWSLFFRQRKRWASKWKHYQSKTPLVLALYIFSCNLSILMAGILWLSGNFSNSDFLILLFVKCFPEWLFLGTILHFLKKSVSIFFIPLTQIFYPFYVCFFGLVAQKPEYEWKGRKLV